MYPYICIGELPNGGRWELPSIAGTWVGQKALVKHGAALTPHPFLKVFPAWGGWSAGGCREPAVGVWHGLEWTSLAG